MSLSDCIKCWDTPCSCGYDYRDWVKKYRIRQAAVVLGVSEEIIIDKLSDVIPEEHPMKEKKQ